MNKIIQLDMSDLNRPEILAAMECPICYETLHPPIGVCDNGHGVCADCHEKLDITTQDLFATCPVCRADFQLSPSTLLESIYDKLKVKCKNNGYGCKVVSYGSQMRSHHKKCYYRVKSCPKADQNCSWEGPMTMLTKHYVENHL